MTRHEAVSASAIGRVSVVIPTLQRADGLAALVQKFAVEPAVREVIVVNNGPDDLHFDSPRVRVLNMGKNIFVNPAWNLGVAEARGDIVAISNDDLDFNPVLLRRAVRLLDRRKVGMVGPDLSGFRQYAGHIADEGRLRSNRVVHRPWGYGTLMILRRGDYVPIPDDGAKIFCGDDWIFMSQKHPNIALSGTGISTEMSTTSGSPEFQSLLNADRDWWLQIAGPALEGTRYWHAWGPRSGRFRPLLMWSREMLSRIDATPDRRHS